MQASQERSKTPPTKVDRNPLAELQSMSLHESFEPEAHWRRDLRIIVTNFEPHLLLMIILCSFVVGCWTIVACASSSSMSRIITSPISLSPSARAYAWTNLPTSGIVRPLRDAGIVNKKGRRVVVRIWLSLYTKMPLRDTWM
jgi:hypothetical protein